MTNRKEIPNKDRNINELLKLMLKNTSRFNNGMCITASRLLTASIITSSEKKTILEYVENNRPSKYSSYDAFVNRNRLFYWTPGRIKPRIKWLKKHIKKTSTL